MLTETATDESLERRLEAYASRRLREAQSLRVTSLSRIPGGASRQTYRFTLSYREAGVEVERKLILRRDPPSSLLESERRIEFGAYRAFHGSAVPVPEMLWLEEDVSHLGQPFFVAEEVFGFESNPYLLLSPPYSDLAATLGQRKWEILGEIAKSDVDAIGYSTLFPVPSVDAPARIALDYWAGVIADDAVRAEPIIGAVIRWMRRNPPPPSQRISVVHGDYRSGNFLYDKSGDIRAILDWEMTHLGDPLEDLAWSLNKAWCFGKDHRHGGLLDKERAIAIWEKSSGLEAPREALHWWELMACVKGQALWVSAARNWLDSPKRQILDALSAWAIINGTDRIALELMGKL